MTTLASTYRVAASETTAARAGRVGAGLQTDPRGATIPTGVSTEVAVAGKPIVTPGSLLARRLQGVPKVFREWSRRRERLGWAGSPECRRSCRSVTAERPTSQPGLTPLLR